MKLADLRAWLFELIAVVIPGAFALLIVVGAITASVTAVGNPLLVGVEAICFPFKLQWINAGFFLSVSFTIGHLLQQLSVYLLRGYAKLRRAPERNSIENVFKLPSVREYVLPKASGIEIGGMGLTSGDIFMMVYPDIAPKTKRDTFIAVSAYCGAMAVVSLLLVTVAFLWLGLLFWSKIGAQWAAPTAIALGSCGVSILWLDRCSFFHDLADRVVVNYFLGTVGSSFRTAKVNPAVDDVRLQETEPAEPGGEDSDDSSNGTTEEKSS